MISAAESFEVGALAGSQSPVACYGLAVSTLAGVAADGDDGHVGIGDLTGHISLGHFHLCQRSAAPHSTAAGSAQLSGILVIDIFGVEVGQVSINRKTVHLEAFLEAADIFLVDSARAGTAGDHVV